MGTLGHRCALVFALVLSVFGCASATPVGKTPAGAEIVQIPLRLSNVFLIKAKAPLLIDTGTIGDMDDLRGALADNGVRVSELSVLVVTHGHADHAGLAVDLRRQSHAKILLGDGDVGLARVGHNDELRPTGLTARLLKPFIPTIYPDFVPDQAVSGAVDLSPYGVDGVVLAMPGHTAGSLVVVLGNHTAFVGDMIAGGAFGGLVFPHSPQEHLFQADPEANRQNITKLLKLGVETFYLGHGGPVTRADVIKAFDMESVAQRAVAP